MSLSSLPPDCAAFMQVLPLLDDSETTPAFAAARTHVRDCPTCQQALADYRQLDAAVRRYYDIVLPPPMTSEAIMSFVAEHTPTPVRSASPSLPRRWPRAISAAIITMLVIILVTGFAITRWHTQIIASSPPTSDLILDGVSMISPDEGWAVGDIYNANWDLNLPKTWKSSTLYHYQHGLWQPIPLKAPAVIAVHLLYLHMLSATDGWAIGDAVVSPGASRQLVMHYDGVTWTPVADAGQLTPDHSNDFIRYTDLQVISANSLWTSAFDLTTSAQETQVPAVGHLIDGHTWKIEDLPLPYQAGNTNLVVTSLAMINDDEGWLAAEVTLPTITTGPAAVTPLPSTSTGPSEGETVLYHRMHGKWMLDSILHDDTAYFTHVAMTSPSDGWALGQQIDQSTNEPIPLLYHYIQQRWTPAATGITVAAGDDTILTMLTAQDGWMLVNGQPLQAYHYDGERWSLAQQIPTPHLSNITLMGASFVSSTDGWVVGYSATYPSKATADYYPLFLHYTHGKWSVYP